MVKTTWKMTGFSELAKDLDELTPVTARNTLIRTGVDAMQPMQDAMARNAPFDEADRDGDGRHLNETMRTQPMTARRSRELGGLDRSKGVTVITGPAPTGKRARDNAGWQERGTVKMPAQPYARPAFDNEVYNVFARLRDAFADQLGKAKERMRRRMARRG